mgnify:CR=1 FL=1
MSEQNITSTQSFIEQKPEMKPIDELTRKFTEKVADLLTLANELAYELVTLDCKDIDKCPICKKSREMVKILKELSEAHRKMRIR